MSERSERTNGTVLENDCPGRYPDQVVGSPVMWSLTPKY